MESNLEILIIDDDEFVAESVSAILNELGYYSICFNSAERGLAYFHVEKNPIIILDINLPKMSGLDILQEIKKINPSTQVIMMTGERDIQNVITSLKLKATDFLFKPFSVQTVNLSIQRALEYYNLIKEKESYQQSIETDLQLAAKVQKKILQPSLSDKKIYTDLQAANFVSGDFYQILKLDNSKYFLFLGDLEGHGIASGLVSFFIISIIKEIIRIHSNPSFILSRVNDELFKEVITHSMTAISLLIEEDKKKIKYAKGGHPSPILFSGKDYSPRFFYEQPGDSLGILSDVSFNTYEEHYESGDVLMLYSDGLFSCKNSDLKSKQKELLKIVSETEKNTETLFSTLKNCIQKYQQSCLDENCCQDDISLILYQL
ncbi:MAG: fused response regulator/phosphatase [Leptospiraceae bacterium]|nr:fused response regulator/phosphatase [Leptospiraceae bacterium]